MLSGIRTGKKKKKVNVAIAPAIDANNNDTSQTNHPPSSTRTTNSDNSKNDNISAAERLRQALAQGGSLPIKNNDATASSTGTSKKSYMERITNRSDTLSSSTANNGPSSSFVVLDAPGMASRYVGKREEDMSVTELAAKERTLGDSSMSWNEQIARDVVRVGKKRKMKEKSSTAQDSDEEVERMKKHLPDNDEFVKKSTKQVAKEKQRNRRRQIDQYQKQEKITSMCSWWINSSSFDKHRLLAFGKHVSLMMAPMNQSLECGNQFYLVPLKHAPSFVDCDDDGVWEEVAMFRRSLENVYAKELKGIILLETVLPNKGFWQTKMDVVPVPFSVLQDSPIYFKSSLAEQADDNGTHNKLLKTTVEKPLRNAIPKKFPYFYIDWGNITNCSNTGYAQIIESSGFRPDFGLDTIAGMMDLDPIRFSRKKKFPTDMERELIKEFNEKWKAFDWTAQLEDDF